MLSVYPPPKHRNHPPFPPRPHGRATLSCPVCCASHVPFLFVGSAAINIKPTFADAFSNLASAYKVTRQTHTWQRHWVPKIPLA